MDKIVLKYFFIRLVPLQQSVMQKNSSTRREL